VTRAVVIVALLCFQASFAHAQGAPVEPGVREVLAMAKHAAGTLGPERTRALCKRARLSGLVPSLRLAARRGLKQDTSSSSTITSDRTDLSAGDDLMLEAGLSFELPRLVFASEEVRLLSVERWLVNDLRRFLEEVTHLYFQRRRLLAERAASAAPDAELDTQIAELEALLDAFTDGGFGRALARARAARPAAAAEPAPSAPSAPPASAEAPVENSRAEAP
jgi:hypothetical protein